MEQNKPTPKKLLKLKGEVLDNEKNPLREVSVKIYRHINFSDISKQGELKTNINGRYEIKFVAGTSVMIRFDCSNRHPVIISLLWINEPPDQHRYEQNRHWAWPR